MNSEGQVMQLQSKTCKFFFNPRWLHLSANCFSVKNQVMAEEYNGGKLFRRSRSLNHRFERSNLQFYRLRLIANTVVKVLT